MMTAAPRTGTSKMTAVRSTLKRAGLVLACAALGSSFIAQPAAADSGTFYKSRSGCVYTGGISALHNYAWTRKDSGECLGHGWLRIQHSDGTYWEGHSTPGVTYSTVQNGIVRAWHKTQSGEDWVQSH